MRAGQDGENNTQVIGDGNSIHNYVNHLKAAPKSIKILAIVNNTKAIVFSILLTLGIIFIIDFYFYNMKIPSSISIPIAIVLTLLLSYLSTKFMRWWSWGHIVYHDKILTYRGRDRKFYDEIWDMKISKSLFGAGVITYCGVNPDKLMVYGHKIKFEYYAEAKYVYDSFHSLKE